MQLILELSLGLFNGWILIIIFYIIFGLLIAIFPEPAVARLYDKTGWTRKQNLLTLFAKIFGLLSIVLLIFTPLQYPQPIFYWSITIFTLGTGLMVIALLNFRNTPLDEPIRKGLYKYSRNPQWIGLVLVGFGTAVACGSWIVVIINLLGAITGHQRILAEERACLQQYGEPYKKYLEQAPRYFWFL